MLEGITEEKIRFFGKIKKEIEDVIIYHHSFIEYIYIVTEIKEVSKIDLLVLELIVSYKVVYKSA